MNTLGRNFVLFLLTLLVTNLLVAAESELPEAEERTLRRWAAEMNVDIPPNFSQMQRRNLLEELGYAIAFLEKKETLTACHVVDEASTHIKFGDKIHLLRSYFTQDMRLEHETVDARPPMTGPGGNAIQPKLEMIEIPHPSKVGQTKFDFGLVFKVMLTAAPDHNTPSMHDIILKRRIRETENPTPGCDTPAGEEEVVLQVVQHPSGARHGGRAHFH